MTLKEIELLNAKHEQKVLEELLKNIKECKTVDECKHCVEASLIVTVRRYNDVNNMTDDEFKKLIHKLKENK